MHICIAHKLPNPMPFNIPTVHTNASWIHHLLQVYGSRFYAAHIKINTYSLRQQHTIACEPHMPIRTHEHPHSWNTRTSETNMHEYIARFIRITQRFGGNNNNYNVDVEDTALASAHRSSDSSPGERVTK